MAMPILHREHWPQLGEGTGPRSPNKTGIMEPAPGLPDSSQCSTFGGGFFQGVPPVPPRYLSWNPPD
jgi:hypothetical protein